MQCEGESLLSVEGLEFSYKDEQTLRDITFDVSKGEFVALMGPNGSGKTTTMRCINQILKGKGLITVDGIDLSTLPMSEIARICTTVPADTTTDFVLSVRDFVSLGRSPFVTNVWWEGDKDTEIIDRALRSLDLEKYADRRLSELSSGERARVLLAKGMAQTPEVMLVDEPSAHLDIKYKVQIMEILSALSRTGIGIVIASHDINLITRFCDRILLLSKGRIVGYGRPEDVVTEESIKEVFDIDVEIVHSHGVPYMLPTGSTGFELKRRRSEQTRQKSCCLERATSVLDVLEHEAAQCPLSPLVIPQGSRGSKPRFSTLYGVHGARKAPIPVFREQAYRAAWLHSAPQ